MEGYKYTSLEQRVKVPFARSIPSPENMALEKFIAGKHDDARHEGKRAELRRMASADQSLKDYQTGAYPEFVQRSLPLVDMQEGVEVIFPMETAQPFRTNTIDIPLNNS